MSRFCTYSHFFSKNFQHICVLLVVNFNESLTNDVVSFEQLDPGGHSYHNLASYFNIITVCAVPPYGPPSFKPHLICQVQEEKI